MAIGALRTCKHGRMYTIGLQVLSSSLPNLKDKSASCITLISIKVIVEMIGRYIFFSSKFQLAPVAF